MNCGNYHKHFIVLMRFCFDFDFNYYYYEFSRTKWKGIAIQLAKGSFIARFILSQWTSYFSTVYLAAANYDVVVIDLLSLLLLRLFAIIIIELMINNF